MSFGEYPFGSSDNPKTGKDKVTGKGKKQGKVVSHRHEFVPIEEMPAEALNPEEALIAKEEHEKLHHLEDESYTNFDHLDEDGEEEKSSDETESGITAPRTLGSRKSRVYIAKELDKKYSSRNHDAHKGTHKPKKKDYGPGSALKRKFG